jgi:hypothetical protein
MSSINALGMFEYFVGHGIGEASNFDVARVIVYHQQVVLLLPLKQVHADLLPGQLWWFRLHQWLGSLLLVLATHCAPSDKILQLLC